MSSIYDRLTDLDISLPPLAIPAGAYVPFVRTAASLVFISGHIARSATARPGSASSVAT
jgi:hypothetical protein